MLRIESQSAYVLHTRPYLETSLIVDLFTRDFGRLSAVARGAKRGESRGRGILQPFVPLLVSCSGQKDLLTLRHFEAISPPAALTGRRLVSAFYLNELLTRLLQNRDSNQPLFQLYRNSLIELEKAGDEQIILRLFEKSLLKALGYELQLTHDVESGAIVEKEKEYYFDPERGPFLIQSENSENQQSSENERSPEDKESPEDKQSPENRQNPENKLETLSLSNRSTHSSNRSVQNYRIFKGKSLLALHEELFSDPKVLQDAKIIMRHALERHLGGRELETRKIFR